MFAGRARIVSDIDRTHVGFAEPPQLVLGARSYHTRPAATITTTAANPDGRLDAATVTGVGSKSVFLNGCHSAEQGLRLVEDGSIGGTVTCEEIQNGTAVAVGRTIDRLLDWGYSLYAAIDLLRQDTHIGQQYRILGDGLTTVAQSEGGIPIVSEIATADTGLTVTFYEYLSPIYDVGTITRTYIESPTEHCLSPKLIGPFSLTNDELIEFLELEPIPVLLNGELRWSDELRLDELLGAR